MNISEVRLTLIQQIISHGVSEPNAIQRIIEPLAQYVITGKHPKDQQIELVQQLRGCAEFCRDKGEVKTPELLERAADLLERKISPPKKP